MNKNQTNEVKAYSKQASEVAAEIIDNANIFDIVELLNYRNIQDLFDDNPCLMQVVQKEITKRLNKDFDWTHSILSNSQINIIDENGEVLEVDDDYRC